MSFPEDRKYTKEHEWALKEGELVTIGITEHAQSSLGDIVFLELPEVGREVKKGDSFGVIESVKAVSDLYAPASGVVKEIHSKLIEDPSIVNQDPHGEGWLIKMAPSDQDELSSLIDANSYSDYVKTLS